MIGLIVLLMSLIHLVTGISCTFGEGFWETAPWYSVEGLQDIANLHDQTLESGHHMKEFDYGLDYKQLDFTDPETRKLYRIGRGEQGVLLVRPYTNDICAHWRFVDEPTARKSADKIYQMYLGFKTQRRLHWYGHGKEVLGNGFYESTSLCKSLQWTEVR